LAPFDPALLDGGMFMLFESFGGALEPVALPAASKLAMVCWSSLPVTRKPFFC
jgi:hypothetical protein